MLLYPSMSPEEVQNTSLELMADPFPSQAPLEPLTNMLPDCPATKWDSEGINIAKEQAAYKVMCNAWSLRKTPSHKAAAHLENKLTNTRRP